MMGLDFVAPGQSGDFIPAATATRWCPAAEYVTTPPPVDWPVDDVQSVRPVSASSANTLPPKSAENTRLLAVGVTPAKIGLSAWCFQRTAPFSASKAVIQPVAGSFRLLISFGGLVAPNQNSPGVPRVGVFAN